MKNAFRFTLALALLAAFVAVAVPHAHAQHVASILTDPANLIGPGMFGVGMFEQRTMLPSNIVTQTYAFLDSRLRPQSLEAPEALPWVLYDTVVYPIAGIAHLDAFRNVNADPTLSNMEQPGSLAAGVYFDVHRIFVTPLTPSPSLATTLDDVGILYNNARATFTFLINSKPVGPFPLRFAGDAGQPSQQGNTTVDVNNYLGGPQNGGFPVNGSIKIGPTQKFGVSLDFAAAAVTANLSLQVALLGILYRKIG
jgi:hypothetical protein